jgi:hypothetical protein
MAAGILSITFFVTASQVTINRLLGISIISLVSVLLFGWSLSDELHKDATLLVFILPALFTFGVGSFWFLLPSVAVARIPVVVLYGIGMYALALTANIIAVSKVRTIALLRAAKSVSFVITLVTSFLLFDAIFSLKANIIVNMLLSFVTVLLLFLPAVWVTNLSRKISRDVIIHSVAYSYIIGLFSGMLYFLPVSVVIASILLTVSLYVILGLAQAHHEGRLFKETAREYLIVGLLVFLTMILSTSWRG